MAVYPQQNNNFSKSPAPLDYDLQSEKQRIAEATEEIKKELWEKWQKRYANAEIFPKTISSMNPNLIDFLLSFQHTLFYNDLAKKFALSSQQRDILPQITWRICLTKNWDGLDSLLQTNLKINSSVSGQIASLLNQNILSKAKELASARFETNKMPVSAVENKISITIADALKAYPEVGEQLITSEKIVLKNFPDPVRPCLKNWLADFTFTLGRDKHTAMERGIYLFQSANGKRLNSQDRNKLAYILKAFDEGLTVTINKDSKQIVFSSAISNSPETASPRIPNNQIPISNKTPNLNDQNIGSISHNSQPLRSSDIHQNSAFDTKKDIPRTTNQESSASIRFSSPQKLPYEKVSTVNTAKPTPSETPASNGQFNQPKTTPPFRFNPVSGVVYDSEKKENGDLQDKGNHINRKNVVNLKDLQ